MTTPYPIHVNAAHVGRYIHSMTSRGFNAQQVLAGVGLCEGDLSGHETSINARQYQIVIVNMLALSGNAALGAEIGQEVGCPDMGVLGYAMMSSSTLRRAVNIWLSYNKTLYGTFIDSKLTETKATWTIETEVLLPLGPAYRFCVEEFLMFSRHMGSSLSDQVPVFHHINLPYPRPEHAEKYERYFDCPVHYNTGLFEIVVSSPSLDTGITSRNAELNRTYMDFCDKIAAETGGHNASIQTQFYNAFLRSPDCLPSLPAMANKLGMSERKLQRKLSAEGTSYRKMAAAFRVEMAKEYLLSTGISCKEIAFHLGFTDTSHFVKVFKGDTGATPERFREAVRAKQS